MYISWTLILLLLINTFSPNNYIRFLTLGNLEIKLSADNSKYDFFKLWKNFYLGNQIRHAYLNLLLSRDLFDKT